MFEVDLPDPTDLRAADDAAVVTAIEGWARVEAIAAARRLDAIAELVERYPGGGERAHWSCDFWDAAAAEVASALNVRHGRASGQMDLAITLRHRLPQVAALFADGTVSARVVTAIALRTYLVKDDEALRQIDAELAQCARVWGPLSDNKLEQAIDLWVDRYDPGGLRHIRGSARGREVNIGDRNDSHGTTSVWGRLYATDAAVLNRRLQQMAHGVCEEDERTIAQRRADALGALAAGSDHLACQCGAPDCPNASSDGRPSSVVIHVVAEQAAPTGREDPYMDGDDPDTREITPDMNLIEALTPLPEPVPPYDEADKPPAAAIMGGGIVPTPLLAALVRAGAKVRHVNARVGDEAESGYRPSTRLAEFIRVRDLTCRFPGCDRPAEYCDIDHTVPYPLGLTHPSNLKCVCRKQHQTRQVHSSSWKRPCTCESAAMFLASISG